MSQDHTENAVEHFVPDYHDCPDINQLVEDRITVPIRRVPAVPITSNQVEELPYGVFSTSWAHYNFQGPLTPEKFAADLAGAMDSFAGDLNKLDEFKAYPINRNPPTTYGVAYHDWKGVDYPFDVRLIMEYKTIEVPDVKGTDGQPVMEYGIQFHLVTLIGKG